MRRQHHIAMRKYGWLLFAQITFIMVTISLTGACPSSAASVQVIALGDSLTQGTMDANDNVENTLNAYLQKMVNSLSTVAPLKFSQPLYGFLEQRLLPFQVPTNLGVDGADIFSLEGYEYYKRVGAATSYLTNAYRCDSDWPFQFQDNYDRVLYPINVVAGQSVSQLDAALTLLKRQEAAQDGSAAVVFLWIGNNDSSLAALGTGGSNPFYMPLPLDAISSEISPVLNLFLQTARSKGLASFDPYTLQAIQRNMTDVSDFTTQINHILDRLHQENPMGDSRTHIFLMTLPYYSAVGYLFDSDDLEFYLQQVNPAYQVPTTFQRVAQPGETITNPFKGDRVSLLTFAFMYGLLQSGYSVDEVNAILEKNGVQQDGMVLSESEQQYIMSRIDSFNDAIKAAAGSYSNVTVLDVGAYLDDVLSGATPVKVGGKTLSRKWSRGSAFSLDGVHPGYTGQALIANYLLGKLNDMYQLNAPLIDLSQVMAQDPYVDRDGDGWVSAPSYPPGSGLTQLLFMFTDPDDTSASTKPTLPSDFWQKVSSVLLKKISGQSETLQQTADSVSIRQ